MERFDARETLLPGVYEVFAKPRGDERGSFERVFCAEELKEVGFNQPIAQINLSFNAHKGTLRGLHFQKPPFTEIKMVRCTQGCVYDVAVDLRHDSLTFLKYVAVELDAGKHNFLVLPKGVAHGFQSLTDTSELFYFLSRPYSPCCDGGVNALDPCLNIQWPLAVGPRSERDQRLPLIEDFMRVNPNLNWECEI